MKMNIPLATNTNRYIQVLDNFQAGTRQLNTELDIFVRILKHCVKDKT